MNDNTNTPVPQEPKDVANDLLQNILAVLVKHIDARVESKVNEIFQSHATMSLIDERTKEMLKDLVDESINEHESDNEHLTNDDIVETIATHIAHTDFTPQVQSAVSDILSDGDYVTEDRVVDIVTDEIDFEEKVKEVLRNI
jgi:hypothetical protein